MLTPCCAKWPVRGLTMTHFKRKDLELVISGLNLKESDKLLYYKLETMSVRDLNSQLLVGKNSLINIFHF